jgi:hypothetical protein
MRGASALASVLKDREHAPVRAFVVWEPVIFTDAFRPRDETLASKVRDPRATHFWDPKKSLSKEILRAPWTRKYAVRGGPTATVWDWVAIFSPDARWDEHFPEPMEQEFPVVDAKDRMGAWIDRAAAAM